MTHEPERDFQPAVADWFRDRYGTDAVETGAHIDDPDWYCDIVVDVGFAVLYIEVENDADAVRPGLAQALGYAADDEVAGVPMVVTPVDHIDDTRADYLRRSSHALIREFDVDAGVFVR